MNMSRRQLSFSACVRCSHQTGFGRALDLGRHSPNGPGAQPRIFEMEDTGETLRIVKAFTGEGQ